MTKKKGNDISVKLNELRECIRSFYSTLNDQLFYSGILKEEELFSVIILAAIEDRVMQNDQDFLKELNIVDQDFPKEVNIFDPDWNETSGRKLTYDDYLNQKIYSHIETKLLFEFFSLNEREIVDLVMLNRQFKSIYDFCRDLINNFGSLSIEDTWFLKNVDIFPRSIEFSSERIKDEFYLSRHSLGIIWKLLAKENKNFSIYQPNNYLSLFHDRLLENKFDVQYKLKPYLVRPSIFEEVNQMLASIDVKNANVMDRREALNIAFVNAKDFERVEYLFELKSNNPQLDYAIVVGHGNKLECSFRKKQVKMMIRFEPRTPTVFFIDFNAVFEEVFIADLTQVNRVIGKQSNEFVFRLFGNQIEIEGLSKRVKSEEVYNPSQMIIRNYLITD